MLTPSLFVLCVTLIGHGTLGSEVDRSLSRHKRSSPDDGAPTCADDYLATSVCVACAALPKGMELPLEACCDSDLLQTVCAACLTDLDRCARDTASVKLDELEALRSDLDAEQPAADDDGTSKRFGRLFVGGSGSASAAASGRRDEKRYGRLFTASGPTYFRSPSAAYREKRFGTLFLGSAGAGYGRGRDKRYGTLFMGKRFGRLFLGSGYGRWRDDKRSRDSDLPIDLKGEERRKRYGRLFLSSLRRIGSVDKKSV